MPTTKDVLLFQLQTGQMLFQQYSEDLSDQEYFQPPVEGANHAAWILGHIAASEDSMTASITGTPKHLPDSIHDTFQMGSTCVADASKYPTRKEIDDMFINTRANVLEALQTFDDSKWNDPSPEGYPKDFFPTIGSIWSMIGVHQFWHIGQLTVCRQAMKKKNKL